MADVFFAVLMNMVVCFDPQYIVFNGLPRQYHKCFEQRIYLNFQDFLYFQDVKQQMKLIFQLEDLFEIYTKEYTVVTFLAILNLARKGQLNINQDRNLNTIVLSLKGEA